MEDSTQGSSIDRNIRPGQPGTAWAHTCPSEAWELPEMAETLL